MNNKIIVSFDSTMQGSMEWKNNLILPIHKKGDQTLCNNYYRPICLAQSNFKIYTRILKIRLRGHIEAKLEKGQAAFRPGKQANDNIYILRTLIDNTIEAGEEMYLAFIDLKAAFDTVGREKIWEVLEDLEVPEALINIIESTNETVKLIVQIGGRRSGEFSIKKGIKQG